MWILGLKGLTGDKRQTIHLLVSGHIAQLSRDPLVWLLVSLTSACLFSADTKR